MKINEIMLQNETLFSKYATFDKEAIRLKDFTPDIRPNYFRDIDRIIHTKSYARYMDKTQVYVKRNNDHVTTRMLHVQLVSKIARTIGRALSLNQDLIEAIALGHDLGHVPFGHVGESILNKISQKNGEGYFMHNVQSVRDLLVLEDVNLTIQVLDGILCHDGEILKNGLTYKKKTKEEFLNDYELCYKDKNHAKNLVPMTLEGAVVRLSDVIAYIGRDIEDAIELKKLNKETIPSEITTIIGTSNKDIINTLILDIIENSLGKNTIKFSDKTFEAVKELLSFNCQNIYNKASTEEELIMWEEMFNLVFEKNLYFLEHNKTNNNIFNVFLNNLSEEYNKNNSNARKVIDYIAGMTDDFFIDEYNFLKDN